MNQVVDEIDNRLLMVFRSLTDIDFIESANLQHAHLLSKSIGLKARDLVFLLFQIESTFGIKLSEQFIADGGFDSYSSIKDAVRSTITQTNK